MAARRVEPVLLGLCDGDLDSSRHLTSYRTNKVGGLPDALPGVAAPRPRCVPCGSPLALVLQVYCPLESDHRALHLFACTACPGHWRALRSQAPEVTRPVPTKPPPSSPDWCAGADDWGEEEEEEGDRTLMNKVSSPVGEGAVKTPELDVRLHNLTLQGGEQEARDVPVLRPFFVSVVEESDLCAEEDLDHAQLLLREYERREGVVVGGLEAPRAGSGETEEEQYEKSQARHGDAVFSRFLKRISACPEQILRYRWAGEPLFISEPPPDLHRGPPACGACGGPRTFELQLMPALVNLLRPQGPDPAAELEFGTVLVFTCRGSCWTSRSPREEFTFLQHDPDQLLFR